MPTTREAAVQAPENQCDEPGTLPGRDDPPRATASEGGTTPGADGATVTPVACDGTCTPDAVAAPFARVLFGDPTAACPSGYDATDIFEDPKMMEAYQAKFNAPLGPPKTWEEYAQIAQFITDQMAPNVYGALFCNGLGVTRGTVTGTLLADMIAGQRHELTDFLLSTSGPITLPPEPFLSIGVNATLWWGQRKAGMES